MVCHMVQESLQRRLSLLSTYDSHWCLRYRWLPPVPIRHPLLSLDSYCLQIPALCQTETESFNEIHTLPNLLLVLPRDTLLSLCHREGLELPLLWLTLATTHPELASLGEQIIFRVQALIEQENKSCTGDDFKVLAEQLLSFCDSVLDFVETVLATYGHYNNIAHWVEQIYKAVQKLGSASSTAIVTSTPSNTLNKLL
jgi:hypothetical protein